MSALLTTRSIAGWVSTASGAWPTGRSLLGSTGKSRREGDATFVTYHTPVGSVSCKILHTEEMKRAGASITWISEPVIKEAKDYRVVGHIFKKIKISSRL